MTSEIGLRLGLAKRYGRETEDVNYEDRTDLLLPEQVVSALTLARLGEENEDEDLMRRAAQDASTSVSPPAREAMQTRVDQDCAADQGASPKASAVEFDAMLWGYRFGRLRLSPSIESSSSPEVLRERAERVDLYGLLRLLPTTPIGPDVSRELLRRNDAVEDEFALEEAVAWAWAFGFGVAVIEADG